MDTSARLDRSRARKRRRAKRTECGRLRYTSPSSCTWMPPEASVSTRRPGAATATEEVTPGAIAWCRAIVTSICSTPPNSRPLATCTTRMVLKTRMVSIREAGRKSCCDRLPEPGHHFDRIARQDGVIRLDVLDHHLLAVDDPGDANSA